MTLFDVERFSGSAGQCVSGCVTTHLCSPRARVHLQSEHRHRRPHRHAAHRRGRRNTGSTRALQLATTTAADATHVCCAWRSAAFSDCAFGRSSFVKCFRCARGCSARRLGLARHGGFVAWSARQSATRGLPLRTSHARVDRGRRRPRVARTSRNARRALVALAAAKEQGHLDTPRAPVCVASRFVLPPARCSAAPSSSRCAPAKGRRVRAGA